ncbi:MAG: ATP-grasp domain-containing protein [Bacteroidota bacterium]
MRILYCDSVFDPKQVELEYEAEREAALKAGFSVSLISFEELVAEDVRKALRFVPASEEKEVGLYRGWMLTPAQYQSLYEELLAKNIELINTPTAYQHCHYLPESYEKIQSRTPKSVWTTELNEKAILEQTNRFGATPIIVKDFVKSEKHHWEEACFVPDASDTTHVMKVVHKFLELRGDSLNEGLVFRQFEELEYLTQHSKSGMPLTKEFRVFFAKGQIVSVFDYWDEGDYGESKPKLSAFLEIAQQIESNFFTMDIAQKKDGDWIIMELGDGQVAGLPDKADRSLFYENLSKTIS